MSLAKGNDVYVQVLKICGTQSLTWRHFPTGFRGRKAEKAVCKAHVWARNIIDTRLVVLNAIEEVNPVSARCELKK